MSAFLDLFSTSSGKIINHPSFKNVLDELRQAVVEKIELNYQRNLMLLGPSGVGKSTVVKKLCEEFPTVYDHEKERNRMSIVLVVVPSRPTVKNMAEEILIALGDPYFSRGSATSKTSRIINFLKEFEVKSVVFDEMHHFVDQGNAATRREVTDWLKVLTDKTEVSTVLCGLQRTELLLDMNEQLRRRFSQSLHLDACGLDNAKVFAGIINFYLDAMELQKKVAITSDLIKRMHYATNGIMDYVRKMMIGVYRVNQIEGQSKITADTLQKAFLREVWGKSPETLNPFSNDFVWRRLDKQGEPFYRPLYADRAEANGKEATE